MGNPPGPTDSPTTPQPTREQTVPHAQYRREGWPVCACGTPMHPEHVETKHGHKVERYHCPRRNWWNRWWHPHAWLEPRQRVDP